MDGKIWMSKRSERWVVCAVQPDREREMDNGRSMQGKKKLEAAEIFIVW